MTTPHDPTAIKARIAEKLSERIYKFLTPEDQWIHWPDDNDCQAILNETKNAFTNYDKELNHLIPHTSPYKHLTPAQLVNVIAQREEQMGKFMEDKELLDFVQANLFNHGKVGWRVETDSAGFFSISQNPNTNNPIKSVRVAIRNAITKQKEKE